MSSQARAFATKVKVGDWVVTPNMGPERLLFIGEITGKYDYDPKKSELKHSHTVDWRFGAWKREEFDEDIIRSVDAFDSFMMFFKLRQDKRIKEIVGNGKPFSPLPLLPIKRSSINKPEAEPMEETEPAAVIDNSELKESIEEIKKIIEEIKKTNTEVKRTNTENKKVINEVNETISFVRKSNINEAAEVRKVIEEVKDVIIEVKETITEVKKATINEATEVKKVISEVRDAIDASAEASAAASAAAAPADGAGSTVYVSGSSKRCLMCDPSYYDILKTRRCFRR